MKNILMNKADIGRTITRISHEIIEKNKTAEDLVIIGIKTRGVNLAEMISKKIGEITSSSLQVIELDVYNYRDDLDDEKKGTSLIKTNNISKSDIENKKIILVDDVLYTGRTIRAALNAILEFGRPENIQLAVLIDRGHRELPIRADYIGKNIPTSKNEKIQVLIQPVDNEDAVVIV